MGRRALLLVTLFWLPVLAAGEDGELRFVDVPVQGRQGASALESLSFDVAGYNSRTGTAGLVATEPELRRLESLGFTWSVRRTAVLGERAETLQDYVDTAEISAFLDQVEAQYPDLAKKVALSGPLFEGQVVYAMKITRGVSGDVDKPAFVLNAQHHAREVMTPEIALDCIGYLTSRYGQDPQVTRWLDELVVWVVPSVNPDGAHHVFTAHNMWRKNRHPGCAVDINRNYPFSWNACEGSDDFCASEVNRGDGPESEPETRAMDALMADAHATFSINYHQYGEFIVYPLGCEQSSDAAIFEAVGDGLVAGLVNDDGRAGSYDISKTNIGGMSVDTEYGRYGTFPFLIETGCCDFQPDYASMRDVTVERQRFAWQYFLDRTLEAPQIAGHVRDAATLRGLEAQVDVEEAPLVHGEWPRKADSHGRYFRLLEPNRTYHVTFSAPGYCSQTVSAAVGAGPEVVDVALIPAASESPSGPVPADGAADQPTAVSLAWEDLGAAQYEVYFGTQQNPPLAATVSGPIWSPPALSAGTTYYWKIAVTTPCGSVSGPVWSFSTTAYTITSVSSSGGPFRLTVTGGTFGTDCRVRVDGTDVPQTLYKNEGKLVAKGGAALKAMVPSGVPVTVTVEDAQGRRSAGFSFTR
jgi:hypothetical protein